MYVALNVGLAAALLIVVLVSQSIWLAILLVLLGKWRALAVRPRFWFANLVANMVDIIVGISIVIFLFGANGMLLLQIIITLLHIIWLLWIKPRSSRHFIAIQAGTAVFLGITALAMVSYNWDTLFFVAAMWGIGYSATRHVLGSYDEPHTVLYSLIAGMIFAELGWAGYHWLVAYPLHLGIIQIPQLAIFLTLYCLVAERAYASYHRHGVVRRADVLMPIMLAVGTTITLFILTFLLGSSVL